MTNILLLSCLSGIFYSMGGTGGGKWWGNRYWRRAGCPILLMVGLLFVNVPISLWWILVLGLSYASITTYHDYLVPDGSENWLCWLVTGFTYGCTLLPFVFIWKLVLLRAVVLGITTMAWSEAISWDRLEEFGRGFLYIFTLSLLLL